MPVSYQKDFQEDKEAVFDTVDTVRMCLNVATIVLNNLTVNEARTRSAAVKGYLNATELADYLVKKGVPFRTAHDTVGRIVLIATDQGKELNEMSLEDLAKVSDQIEADVFSVLSLDQTLASKSQTGGTSPSRVAEALTAARKRME